MNEHLTRPIVFRSAVVAGKGYESYREELRRDFAWSCAYCSRAEGEVQATSFHIDHYKPRAAGGSDEYANLYYACAKCNHDKGDLISCGPPDHRRVIRPDVENPDVHLSLAHDRVDLEPLSPVGEFNIEVLRLNALSHRRVRLLRAQYHEAAEVIAHGLRILRHARIDMLQPRAKPAVLRTIGQLKKQHGTVEAALEKVLRSIDADASSPEELRRRRAYLSRQNVLSLRPKKR